MASGDTLLSWTPQAGEPPASNPAAPDARNQHPVIDFALNEITVFSGIMPQHYGGGGVTVYIHYAMSSATTNDINIETSFERIGDGQQDIDTDGFASAQSNEETVPGTCGHVSILSIAHTDGAPMDSVAVGEAFRLKIERIAATGDDATGDLELRGVELRET